MTPTGLFWMAVALPRRPVTGPVVLCALTRAKSVAARAGVKMEESMLGYACAWDVLRKMILVG